MLCCWSPFKGRRRQREEWGDRWLVKVVVVGDSQSGKTTLIQRYCSGTIPPTYTPTLFDTTTVTSVVGERKVQMVIQDTAGQEDLDRLRPTFYMHADVIVVCFCPSSPDSWDKVRNKWVPEARRYCGKHVPLLLVASKTDQAPGQASPFLSIPVPHHSHLDQGQGQGDVSFVDHRLHPSVGEEAVHGDDHPVFRDVTRDNDDNETAPGSPRDSGFFEWTENLVPGSALLTQEGKTPHLGMNHSRAWNRTEQAAFRDRATQGSDSSRQSVSTVNQLGGQEDDECSGGKGGPGGRQDGVRGGQVSGHSVARQVGAVGYFETSALLDRGLEQVFDTALTAAMASKQWRKKYRL